MSITHARLPRDTSAREFTRSARGARLPKDVRFPEVVGHAAEHEKQVAQSVHVTDGFLIHAAGFAFVERHDVTFRASDDRSSEVHRRGELGAARKHETIERREILVELIDHAFKTGGLRRDDTKPGVGLFIFRQGCGEVGSEVKEIVLNLPQFRCQPLRHLCIGMMTDVCQSDTDCRVGLVNRAIGFHARIILADSRAADEAGRAIIAGSGINSVEFDHRTTPFATQSASDAARMKNTESISESAADIRGLKGLWKRRSGGRPSEVTNLADRVLASRGFIDSSAATRFLEPQLSHLHDPSLLPGIEESAARLLRAVEARERIAIYGDYDVDGISATAILFHMLHAVGAHLGVNVEIECYVPHRLEEGYGLNSDAMKDIASRGTRLVVSVDCGVTAFEPASCAKSLGMDLIITDHHNLPEPSQGLPSAIAIVHPRLPGTSYPFGELCGAGVAYKLAWRLATLACGGPKVAPEIRVVLLDLLSFAALGAVADVVPLLDENRVIVRYGLTKIRHSLNEGVQALIEASGLAGEKVEEFDIGFKLAPRLNACGRLGHAREAVELFTTARGDRAMTIARELTALNEKRRAVQDRMFQQALELAETAGMTRDDVRAIVLAHEDWHPGVVGIACSKLVERFHRPVILMGKSDGMCHGSGRSVDGFDLHEAISSCAPLLGHFGGHAMAAGLHVSDTNLKAFTERFCAFVNERIKPEDLCAKIRYDCEANIGEITRAAIEELERIAPFGRDNPSVSLLIRGARVVQQPTILGSTGKHIQFRIGSGMSSQSLRVVGWDWAEYIERLPKDRPVDVVAKPKISKWQDRVSVEAELEDIRPL